MPARLPLLPELPSVWQPANSPRNRNTAAQVLKIRPRTGRQAKRRLFAGRLTRTQQTGDGEQEHGSQNPAHCNLQPIPQRQKP